MNWNVDKVTILAVLSLGHFWPIMEDFMIVIKSNSFDSGGNSQIRSRNIKHGRRQAMFLEKRFQ